MLAQKGFSSLQEALDAAMDEQTFAAASSTLRRHEDSKLRSSEECRRAEEALAEIESRRTAASREQAQAALLAAKSEEAQALRTMGAVKERLAQDGVSRERSEALQRALARNEKLWSEWSQLCALIGSRNGQSFSREAQKLTFRVLLRHANEVLRGMSSRYRLKAGGAEGMEVLVIDRDMAGIERTSANLSGGESFFVSLALALALSEVSTGGMRVDTLFLDEGFGTLDSASLERVLNALEVLQQRSRKLIGLISHVPAVRERLSARIAVRPAGRTGLSLLEGPGLMRLD